MTNKLVVVINSLKVPKIKKKIYYTKWNFSYQITPACSRTPDYGATAPRSPFSVLCPQLNLLNPTLPRTKFLGTPLCCRVRRCTLPVKKGTTLRQIRKVCTWKQARRFVWLIFINGSAGHRSKTNFSKAILCQFGV